MDKNDKMQRQSEENTTCKNNSKYIRETSELDKKIAKKIMHTHYTRIIFADKRVVTVYMI